MGTNQIGSFRSLTTVKSQTAHGLATLRRLLDRWSSPSATRAR
jgi:hypothetical protein